MKNASDAMTAMVVVGEALMLLMMTSVADKGMLSLITATGAPDLRSGMEKDMEVYSAGTGVGFTNHIVPFSQAGITVDKNV